MKKTLALLLMALLVSAASSQVKTLKRPLALAEIKNPKNLVHKAELKKIQSEMGNPGNALPETPKPPRPDLAGLRLMHLTGDAIYLVNPEGYLQWVPNWSTHSLLFEDWDNVYRIDLIDMPVGKPLSHLANWFKSHDEDAIWFVSNGVKRWITSPAVMEKYHFERRVTDYHKVPKIVLDAVPRGPDWY